MLKILIVDDSGISRKMLIRSIPQGIKEISDIIQGKDGAEGVSLFMQHKPNIVFLDLTMPVMDGYEALGKMIEINPDAMIYVISADIQKQAKDRVLNAGAAGMENKPINVEKMSSIFQKLLV